MPMPRFDTVDAYVASIPEPARSRLTELRRLVHAAAPEATEALSYGIIGYKHHGVLVYIGAAKKHVALHAVGTALMDAYAGELTSYRARDYTIRFPLDKPLPVELVTKLVKGRIAENEAKRPSP
jgi:uncharacterized protein YdhG (YjbR/CyaY superfamily)